MEMMLKQDKGMLLTLVTLVLVVLIVGELVTYTYLSIDYESVYSVSTNAKGGLNFLVLSKSGISSFLGSSAYSAAKALALYETSNSQAIVINDTSYALKSLMLGNSIYGNVPNPAIETLPEYVNALVMKGKSEGLSIGLSNQSLSIYQNSSYNISSTYVALVSVNSSAGEAEYPIFQDGSTPVSGLPDLHALQDANNYTIAFGQNPSATAYGNGYAASGSVSPYQFLLGRILLVPNSITGCSGISSAFENANYILATPNDIQMGGSCGFGGVVTYVPNTPYTVPYLVYNSASGMIGSLSNGTLLLLDGKGLALLNVSGTQMAMHSGQYYAGTFAPSYLQWAQGDLYSQSPGGMYSFNLYNRRIPMFRASKTGTYVTVNVPNDPASFSISLWFYDSNTLMEQFFTSPESTSSPWVSMGIANGAICTDVSGSCVDARPKVQNDTWYNYIITYNSTTRTLDAYVNSRSVGSFPDTLSSISSDMYIGVFDLAGSPVGYQVNGSIVNVQVYNTSLTQGQAGRLYDEGIEGGPVLKGNLAGWWPLNGNTKDYSGNNDIGISNSITYTYLRGYTADPVYGGSLYGQNMTNAIGGILNCYNLTQCGSRTQQHLYLGGGGTLEAGALGLANDILPNSAYFEPGSYFNISYDPAFVSGQQYTVSAWIDTTSNSEEIIFSTWDGHGQGYQMFLDNGDLYYWTPGGIAGEFTKTVDDGNWHWVAVAFNAIADTGAMYIDGQHITTGSLGTDSFSGGAGSFQIGTQCRKNGGCDLPYHGSIADVQVYNSALTSNQMSSLYLNDSLPMNGPIGSWPLGQGGFGGLANQTINTANALDVAAIWNATGLCTNANAVYYYGCGITYTAS